MSTQNPNSKLYELVKKIAKKPFHYAGVEIKVSFYPIENEDPLPIFEDPLEALCINQGGRKVAFRCPLDQCITLNGFSYNLDEWHPFVETIREYDSGKCNSYENSILKKYYESYHPKSADEALVGFSQAPQSFFEQPPHIHRLAPWDSRNIEEVDKSVRGAVRKDNAEHGNMDLSFEDGGYHFHGPVSVRKGRLEFERLINLYEKVKSEGYDRRHGDTNFQVLRRDDEFRFLRVGTGAHRTAVMAGLGHETLPAQFHQTHVIDIEMVDYWPQVRGGIWDRSSAVAYFNHLFDFDSRAWTYDCLRDDLRVNF